MSTRSRIGILRADGSIDSIYCHLDGYPEGVGYELYTMYKDKEKVNNLIKLGDISHLEDKLEPDPSKPHEFGYDTEQPNVVVAYHRDRGEKLRSLHSKDISDFKDYCLKSNQEYAYLYEEYNGNWIYSPIPFSFSEDFNMDFTDLKDELLKLNCIDIEQDKFDNLVWKVVDYEKDNDFYEFMDEYGSDEEAFKELKDYFIRNGFEDYKLSLRDNLTYLEEDKNDKTLGGLYKHTQEMLKDILEYQKLDDLEI